MTDPVAVIADALQAHGKVVKWYGDKINAQCPAHEDRNPSLSVAHGKNRDAVIHCHAGCAPDAVMAAIGLKWTDLAPERPRGEITAEYAYHDANGKVLFKVCRTENKRFFQMRLVDGVWVPGLADTPRVLYRLPEVLEAINDPTFKSTIWIAEGEKDVDALRARGLVATCNPMGAGKFRTEHAAVLAKAAAVVIVADNDKPGLDHARDIAFQLALMKGPAPTIVRAAKGKDAADHLANGFGIDEFVPVEWGEEPAAGAEPSPFIDFPALFRDEAPLEDWVLWPLVPRGRGVSVFAGAKQGKSTIVLANVAAVVTGRPVFGVEVQTKAHVLYLDYEMTRQDLKERLLELGYGEDDDWSHLHYALIPSLPPLDTVEGAAAVLELAKSCGAELVVVDTYGRAVVGDEDKADTTRAFYRFTGMTLKGAGIACLRLDHSGKDPEKGARGSSAKNDDVDLVWKLTRAEDHVTLIRTHQRVAWGPDRIEIDKVESDDGIVTYRMAGNRGFVAGTKECAADLDRLGAAVTISRNKAAEVLRKAGLGRKTTVVTDAVRWRKEQARNLPVDKGTTAGTTHFGHVGNSDGNHEPTVPLTSGNRSGNHREPPSEHNWEPLRIPIGDAEGPSAGREPVETEPENYF